MKELIEEGMSEITGSGPIGTTEYLVSTDIKPARKPRKDKGIPKPKPIPAGTLTIEQVQKLRSLMDDVIRTRDAKERADRMLDDATSIYDDFLVSLTRTK